jgi:putative ABC transport system ATP-binding protein
MHDTAASGNGTALMRLRGVGKHYATPFGPCAALADIDLEIGRGECVAVVGKSGSGKTTLINLLAGIDAPSSGELEVAGQRLGGLSQDELATWRGREVGLVFQFFQLLPTLSVVENVMLPMDFAARTPRRAHRPRALQLLERLGIGEQADKLPADLSGGQQQRAAIARALANAPAIVIADEPTGNLDSATAADVMRLLAGLAREGTTVLVVTHERDLVRYFTRVVTLQDGRLVGDVRQ